MPSCTSSTSAGSMPARSTTARTTCPPSTGASVSLNAPRYARPIGVRATETMTASLISWSFVDVGGIQEGRLFAAAVHEQVDPADIAGARRREKGARIADIDGPRHATH